MFPASLKASIFVAFEKRVGWPQKSIEIYVFNFISSSGTTCWEYRTIKSKRNQRGEKINTCNFMKVMLAETGHCSFFMRVFLLK